MNRKFKIGDQVKYVGKFHSFIGTIIEINSEYYHTSSLRVDTSIDNTNFKLYLKQRGFILGEDVEYNSITLNEQYFIHLHCDVIDF